MSVTEELVAWAWELDDAAIPGDVRAAAARHVLDGIGCAIAAHRLDAVPFVVEVAGTLAHPPEATVLGDGRRLPAPAAALANGALVHGLDFDDTHAPSLVHATAAVLPAALAVAEEVGASGRDLLSAVVVGYEVVTRLGAAVPHGFHARGFHATSACGVFAAALVAARLLRLDQQAAVDALGVAGSQASGSLEFLDTSASTKQLHPGWSGFSGILAARLAAAGASGPASILEGERGLYRAYTGTGVEPGAVTAGLGRRWETEAIGFKPYPCCQLSHPSLDALASVRADANLADRIEFEVPTDAVHIVCEPAAQKARPRTPYEAKFSLAWCAAALLVDGGLTVASFDPERIGRPEVLELAARVTYRSVDPGVPAASAPGRVEVRAGGRRVEGRAAAGRVPSDEELLAKFVSNGGAADLAERLLHLDAVDDLAALVKETTVP